MGGQDGEERHSRTTCLVRKHGISKRRGPRVQFFPVLTFHSTYAFNFNTEKTKINRNMKKGWRHNMPLLGRCTAGWAGTSIRRRRLGLGRSLTWWSQSRGASHCWASTSELHGCLCTSMWWSINSEFRVVPRIWRAIYQ
jgi:hypothetical protein